MNDQVLSYKLSSSPSKRVDDCVAQRRSPESSSASNQSAVRGLQSPAVHLLSYRALHQVVRGNYLSTVRGKGNGVWTPFLARSSVTSGSRVNDS